MNVRSSLREILHFGRPAEVCQFEWGYDHHVPPEVSYEDFLYYVEQVRQLYERHGR